MFWDQPGWMRLAEVTAAWLATYWLHSTLLLGGAWLVSGLLRGRRPAVEEWLWRTALVGAILTASLHEVGIGPSVTLAEREGVAETSTAGMAASHMPADRADGLPTPAAAGLAPSNPTRSSIGFQPLLAVSVAALLWAALAAAALGRLALDYWQLAERLRERTRLRSGPLYAIFRCLCTSARVSSRTLLASSRSLRIPIARGLLRPEVCVPGELAEDPSPVRQEVVLAHELAHVRRADPRWLLLYRLIRASLWLQPLNRLAVRRLEEIAEWRCDDLAVELTGRPVTLARCLTEVAAGTLRLPSVDLASAGAALARRRSTLRGRVERLLARDYPRPEQGVPRWMAAAFVAAIAGTAIAAPGISAGRIDSVAALHAIVGVYPDQSLEERPAPQAEPEPPESADSVTAPSDRSAPRSAPAAEPVTAPAAATPPAPPSAVIVPTPEAVPRPDSAPLPPAPHVAPFPPAEFEGALAPLHQLSELSAAIALESARLAALGETMGLESFALAEVGLGVADVTGEIARLNVEIGALRDARRPEIEERLAEARRRLEQARQLALERLELSRERLERQRRLELDRLQDQQDRLEALHERALQSLSEREDRLEVHRQEALDRLRAAEEREREAEERLRSRQREIEQRLMDREREIEERLRDRERVPINTPRPVKPPQSR